MTSSTMKRMLMSPETAAVILPASCVSPHAIACRALVVLAASSSGLVSREPALSASFAKRIKVLV